MLNGDYELEEGQEMNGCARSRWKREEGDFFDGNAWCVGNLEDTPWVESSNTNKWGHPLGLQWVVAGSTGAEVAVCAG